jgi:succinoglycan biosynthesis transport protein ExoP
MQQEAQQNADVDLREYITVVRKQKWFIAIIAGVVVLLSVGMTVRSAPVYTSESRVLVLPTAPANSPFYFLVVINMDTESGLVGSDVVAQLVQDKLETKTSLGTLLSNLSVSVEAGTEILDIDYTSSDPATAQAVAQKFATAYLEFRQSQAENQVTTQITDIQNEISDVSAKISSLQHQIDQENNPTKKQELINQQDADKSRLGVLKQNLADAGAGSIVQPGGQIVQPAYLPSSPSNAGVVRNGFLALIVGLAIGTGIAFLRERLDDRIRDREDLEKHLGVPVLAVVPKVAQWSARNEAHLASISEPWSPASEPYRTLRTSILFMAAQKNLQVLMVTSPSAGDGKTTTCANLSVALAQAGKSVIIVSGDLRKPRLHRFFEGTTNVEGLVDVLTGDRGVRQVLQPSAIPNLSVMACGPISSSPAELLHAPRMAAMLEEMRTLADFVIIDSAPVLVVSDSLAMAALVDGVLFVSEAQSTDRQAVSRARNQLEQVGAPVVGAVMNNFDPSKSGGGYSYRYYYRYGDGYGTGAETLGNGKSPSPEVPPADRPLVIRH